MFKRRNIRHLLAAIGLFAGQLLLLVHASEHQIKSAPDAVCELCTIAHAASSAPAAPVLPAAPPAESFVVQLAALSPAVSAQLQLPPSCGPPALLA